MVFRRRLCDQLSSCQLEAPNTVCKLSHDIDPGPDANCRTVPPPATHRDRNPALGVLLVLLDSKCQIGLRDPNLIIERADLRRLIVLAHPLLGQVLGINTGCGRTSSDLC